MRLIQEGHIRPVEQEVLQRGGGIDSRSHFPLVNHIRTQIKRDRQPQCACPRVLSLKELPPIDGVLILHTENDVDM